jgi:hypothetical protein
MPLAMIFTDSFPVLLLLSALFGLVIRSDRSLVGRLFIEFAGEVLQFHDGDLDFVSTVTMRRSAPFVGRYRYKSFCILEAKAMFCIQYI